MDAIVFDTALRVVHDYPAPDLRPGEALIQPHLVGICNTDIEITRGYMGFRGVLGHEFVGTVVACGQPGWVGTRVVGEINAACFHCEVCLAGVPSHCPDRTTLGIAGRDGAMAECFSLPVRCLHAVPAHVPDHAAVFVEPLAAALEILELSHVRPAERVVVVGDGKLGLLVAQVMRLPGCEVLVTGRHPERWGPLVDMGVAPVAADELRTASCDLVIDCTGNASGLATARRLVRPRGRLVLKSTYHGPSPLDLSILVVDELALLGSRCGPFAPALRLLERGLVQTGFLIAAQYPLADGLTAFAATRGALKVLLQVRSQTA